MESTSDRKASIFSSICAFSSAEIFVEFFFGLFCFGTRAGLTISYKAFSQYTDLNYKHENFINASVDRKRLSFYDYLTRFLIMNHKRCAINLNRFFIFGRFRLFKFRIFFIFCLSQKIVFVRTCSLRPKELIQRQPWRATQLIDGLFTRIRSQRKK